MKALGSTIIIKKIEEDGESLSKGGIHLIENKEMEHGEVCNAKIIAIGPKNTEGLEVGDTVLTVNGMGVNFDDPDGGEMFLLREGELLAKIV